MTKLISPEAAARDTIGRRSRLARSPTGKRLVLGRRDLKILHWLYRYRYLHQSQLLALLRPRSAKRFVERLCDLYHETGLINRPGAGFGSFELRSTPMLYEITLAGIDWLVAHDALPHRAVTFSFQSRRAHSPQLLHTMMIIETLLALEQQTMTREGERFVPVDEILARAPETTRHAPNPLAIPADLMGGTARAKRKTWLIPDALYGIEYHMDGEKRYRFWALECERTSPTWRSTTSASSTAKKRTAYDKFIASKAFHTHWGIPNLKLQVVRASSRCAKLPLG